MFIEIQFGLPASVTCSSILWGIPNWALRVYLSSVWSSSSKLSQPLMKVNSSDSDRLGDETWRVQMLKQSDGSSIKQLGWMFLLWTEMEAVLKLLPQGGFQTKRWRSEMVALVEAGRMYRTVPRRRGEWDSPSIQEKVTDASVTNFRHKELFVPYT